MKGFPAFDSIVLGSSNILQVDAQHPLGQHYMPHGASSRNQYSPCPWIHASSSSCVPVISKFSPLSPPIYLQLELFHQETVMAKGGEDGNLCL